MQVESPSLRPLALANQSQSHCWLEHFARSLRAYWLQAAAGSLVAQFLAATAAAAEATWARREFAARFPPRKEVKAIVRLFSGTQMQGVASEPACIIAGRKAMGTLSGKRVPGDNCCRLGVSVSVTNPGPCGLPGRQPPLLTAPRDHTLDRDVCGNLPLPAVIDPCQRYA